MRSFWSYAYAEQAASVEFAALLEACQPDKCEMDSALLACQRLPVWQESLRPGSTLPLENALKQCFQRWATDCVGPAQPGAEDPGEAATKAPVPTVSDLLAFGKQFLSQLQKKDYDVFAPLLKRVETEGQKLAKTKLAESLEKAALALKDWDGKSEEAGPLMAFINVSKTCNGIFFSDAISPQDGPRPETF